MMGMGSSAGLSALPFASILSGVAVLVSSMYLYVYTCMYM